MSVIKAAHCVNPNCPRPSPQPWGNKFCHSCGTLLKLQNRYIPLNRLDSGGFATIYTVWDLETQTERVLKVLVESSPKAGELFEQEAAVLMSLRHPGVPLVEPGSYFQIDLVVPQKQRLPCLVMEKIHGQTLQDIVDQYPQGCPEALVLNWLSQSLEILSELHRRHILHRDIKPSNLMVRQASGQLVTIDFGGAKHIGLIRQRQAGSSTRLVSPGYSPPEQVVGTAVSPATDFYALGRTMIHLLTGKYPGDLEDPVTSILQWRHYAQVSPGVADVLDEMVQGDMHLRPTTAAQIQRRLAAVSTIKTIPGWAATKQRQPFYRAIATGLLTGLTGFAVGVSKVALFIIKAIAKIVQACVDTVWEMLLAGLGAILGSSLGFAFAYGMQVSTFITDLLFQVSDGVSDNAIALEPPIILFGLAGVGTAIGLTFAGGFGQRRRFAVAGFISFLGYSLSWLILQAAPTSQPLTSLTGSIVVAVTFLTLGLGLPNYHLLHTIVTTSGTATVFMGLVALNLFPRDVLLNLFSVSTPASWSVLALSIAFFMVIGVSAAFWLGVSYYIFAPFLRWLR